MIKSGSFFIRELFWDLVEKSIRRTIEQFNFKFQK